MPECMSQLATRRFVLMTIAAWSSVGALAAYARIDTAQASPSSPILARVHKDASCGCCSAWAASLDHAKRFETVLIDEIDMAPIKTDLGVPADLHSCHTAEIGGYVIEGHVPAADILRLIDTAPDNARGLAVPGMPAGSPGMERADGVAEHYQVIIFNTDGSRAVFAEYGLP